MEIEIITKKNAPRSRSKNAGAVQSCTKYYVKPLESLSWISGYTGWYSKAERFVGFNYGIYGPALKGLSVTFACLQDLGLLSKGRAISRIINWSGRSRIWQGSMKYAIEEAIVQDLLYRAEVRGGKSIMITQKGYIVLKAIEDRIKLYTKQETK